MWHWWGYGLWNPSCSCSTLLGPSAQSLLVVRQTPAGWVVLCLCSPPELPVNSISHLAATGVLATSGVWITAHWLLLGYLVIAILLCCLRCFPMSMGLQVPFCHQHVLSYFLESVLSASTWLIILCQFKSVLILYHQRAPPRHSYNWEYVAVNYSCSLSIWCFDHFPICLMYQMQFSGNSLPV